MAMTVSTVYLAGPIGDTPAEQVKGWRDQADTQLYRAGLYVINPLRGETPQKDGYYRMDESNPMISSPGVFHKNVFDIRRSDFTLARLPKGSFSTGTIWEIGYAAALNKPIVIWTDDRSFAEHPDLRGSAGWIVEWLDDAVDILAMLARFR